MLVMNYSSIVPQLIIPGMLGIVFNMFPSRREAYKVFFLISAVIHFFSSVLYLKVQSCQEDHWKEIEEAAAGGGSSRKVESIGHEGGPPGARCCDKLCFRSKKPRGGGAVIRKTEVNESLLEVGGGSIQ